jgi:glycosyltransferase involved in cell wall biosynthesis
MNILMMTNTYTPIVGGVEKSISTFSEQLRGKGHQVIIVAPEFDGMPDNEQNVIRLPAIEHFNGTDFSVNLPMPGLLKKLMQTFDPDIIHSHHPFLIGDLALRRARQYGIPLIFTYHTMFEQYVHYLPIQNEQIKKFVIELSCGYANLADKVIVPTESILKVLHERKVRTPIEVIPTSIDTQFLAKGNRNRIRQEYNIPKQSYLIGHVGRLEPEKNLIFLAKAVAGFMVKEEAAHFMVVGSGSLKEKIKQIFAEHDLLKKIHFTGIQKGQDLIDCYHAMDIFAFSSHSETQGVVLVEAMAAGIPIIAVDAPGARDIISDFENGRLISQDDESAFADSLLWHFNLKYKRQKIKENAINTAQSYSHENCLKKLISLYKTAKAAPEKDPNTWQQMVSRLKVEWELLKNITEASESALISKDLNDTAG